MYEKLEQTRDELRSKITVRKASGVMLAFVVVGLVCLFQLIITDFNFSALLSFDFYFKLIYKVALIFLVYSATINILYDRELGMERVQIAANKYNEMVKLKDISLKDFLKEYNYNLKAQAWIDKIDRLINKHTSAIAAGRFIKYHSRRVDELEKLQDEEYIKKNWNKLPVRWNEVFYTDFTLVNTNAAYNMRARSEFDKDVRRYSKKKAWKYVLLTCILGMFAVQFAFNNILTAMFWFNLAADVLLVILRITDAACQVPILIDMNFTNVYLYKTDILIEYITWMDENGIENSKAFKILSYIQKLEDEKKKEKNKPGGNPAPKAGAG